MEFVSNLTNNKEFMASALYLFESFLRTFTSIYQFIVILAPTLSVIYIILGGIKLTASGGDHRRVRSAKRMITAAIVGCVIVLIAYPFLNLVGYLFTPEGTELHFLDWYSDIVTLLALVYIVWGGIQYTTSSGKPLQLLEARRTIFYAIQGYVWMLGVRVFFFWFFR